MYELIRQERKGGGSCTSRHSPLGDKCLTEKRNDEYEFITLQIDYKNIITRLLLTYWHLENEPESKEKLFPRN